MEHLQTYSYFLMDKTFNFISKLNESPDYEWDYENNSETNHNNKTVSWLEESLNKSSDKVAWYERFLSKIKNLNYKTKKYILLAILPILMGVIGYNSVIDGSKNANVEIDLIYSLSSDIKKGDIGPKLKSDSKEKTETKGKPFTEEDLGKYFKEKKSFNKFLRAIAKRESSNRWKISNSGGFMGLYQIGNEALKDIGQKTKDPELRELYKIVNKKAFDADPNIFPVKLQNKAFVQLLKNNKSYLKYSRRYTKDKKLVKRNYYKYIGKTIGGIKITESGLLGSAHLVGHGGIKKFLITNGKSNPKDGNGVKCSEYLELFSGYKINI